jgi:hypothetical protein
MAIGEVARRAGTDASAIRYYEKAGPLAEPERSNGRRRGDPSRQPSTGRRPSETAFRHLAFAPGSRPYPTVENTQPGWLVWSPYLGALLRLQGHTGVALGDGRVSEARVPTLSKNRTEDEGRRALVAGGGKPYTRIIPPFGPHGWLVK